MSSLNLKICALGAVLLLTGCSNSLDKYTANDGYLDKVNSSTKPLVLPKDIKDDSMENYYPIPRPKFDDGRHAAKNLTMPPRV